MGVGSEGESSAAVTQHTGYGLDIDSVLQGQGCEGMPQVVKTDMLQPRILEDLLMELHHRIGVVHSAAYRRGEQVGISGVLIVFLFQQFHSFRGQGDSPHGVVGLGWLYLHPALYPVSLLGDGDRQVLRRRRCYTKYLKK